MIGAVIIGAIIGGLVGFVFGAITAVRKDDDEILTRFGKDQYKKGYEDAKRIYRGR